MKREENKVFIKAGITASIVLIVAVVCFFLLYRFEDVSALGQGLTAILQPFIYGGVLTFLLSPLCGKLESLFLKLFHGKHAKLCGGAAILLSVIIALLIISLICLIIIPNTVRSLVSLMNTLPGQIIEFSHRMEEGILFEDPVLQNWWEGISTQISASIEDFRVNGVMPLAQSLLSGTASYVTGFLTLLKNLLVAVVITVYLLASRKHFLVQAKLFLNGVCPEKWVKLIEEEVTYADRMFNGFFMGKLLDSAIVGVLCFAGCLVMKLPSVPLISVIIGVTNIIPFFGPFIGAIPCSLLLLLENPIHCLMFVIFILILQQLDGNVIGPRILGNTTGLSGFWVTFAILLFGGMWGISGMIVGVPLFAVIYDIARKLIYNSLRKRGKTEMIQEYRSVFHPEDSNAGKDAAKAKKPLLAKLFKKDKTQ
ncbi:MAG: AI-2E family transporter [Clostridia bacterium]|nr:AI-2E family transporter [Clostridia bacterium]